MFRWGFRFGLSFVWWLAGTCKCRGTKLFFRMIFACPSNSFLTILKMVQVIENYTHHPLKTHQYENIFIGWKRS